MKLIKSRGSLSSILPLGRLSEAWEFNISPYGLDPGGSDLATIFVLLKCPILPHPYLEAPKDFPKAKEKPTEPWDLKGGGQVVFNYFKLNVSISQTGLCRHKVIQQDFAQ